MKISDFGMSRLVPADEVYVPTSHGLLPLRWMAVESIFHREFTSSSDSWSYGVVLWEICTMGMSFVCVCGGHTGNKLEILSIGNIPMVVTSR